MTGPAAPPQAPTCYRHPGRVTYVSCTRCGRPICGEDQIPASVGFHCPDDVRAASATVRRKQAVYGGRAHDRPLVTEGLVAALVLVFLVTLAGGATLLLGSGASPVYDLLALQPIRLDDGSGPTDGVAQGQWWRLLTAVFVHYGALHLALNAYALLQLGPELERALGRLRFLALFLLSGLAGCAASYAFGPENGRAAGASGAVYGLAGAWLLLARRRRADTGPVVSFLVLGLLLSVSVPNIDLRGHVGGLVGGTLAAAVLFAPPPGPRRGAAQAVGLAALLVLVLAVVAVRTSALR